MSRAKPVNVAHYSWGQDVWLCFRALSKLGQMMGWSDHLTLAQLRHVRELVGVRYQAVLGCPTHGHPPYEQAKAELVVSTKADLDALDLLIAARLRPHHKPLRTRRRDSVSLRKPEE